MEMTSEIPGLFTRMVTQSDISWTWHEEEEEEEVEREDEHPSLSNR